MEDEKYKCNCCGLAYDKNLFLMGMPQYFASVLVGYYLDCQCKSTMFLKIDRLDTDDTVYN